MNLEEREREKEALLNRIKVVENEITAIKKTQKAEPKSFRREMRTQATESKDQLVSQAAKIDTLHENTLERIDELKMATSGNSSDLRQLTDQVEYLDNKSRKKEYCGGRTPRKG